jgi:diguanylate cyclase (GGDEF)-like protein
VQSAISKVLTAAASRVTCVGSAALAYAAIAEQAWDLVIVSDVLGGGAALDLVRAARESTAPPVALLIEVDSKARAKAACKVGASDTLRQGAPIPAGLKRAARFARVRREDRARLEAAAEHLTRLTRMDPLTELLNRRGAEDVLRRLQRRHREHGEQSIVLLVDLDGFKRVNDTFGYATGDHVLREVARTLRRLGRPTDVHARVGGDEFLVLLPVLDKDEGIRGAERVRMALAAERVEAGGQSIPVTASIGIARLTPGAASVEDLLVSTQRGLKRSKLAGKNRVAWGGNTIKLFDSQLALEGVVPQLCTGEGLSVRAQPVIDLATGRPVGVELFTRGPEGPYQRPEDFLALALERSVLSVVDLRCLRLCVEAARQLEVSVGSVHLNVLPTTLLELDPRELESILRPIGLARVVLDLGERHLSGAPAALAERLLPLRQAGLELSVDDLGNGRSSVESLVALNPDIVKIDRRAIETAVQDPASASRLERLCRLAHALAPVTIAEGVETEAERAMVERLGVTCAQGFLFGLCEAL